MLTESGVDWLAGVSALFAAERWRCTIHPGQQLDWGKYRNQKFMASAESKIAGAITAVAVSIIVAFVVVPEIKEHRARAEINQMVKEFTEEMDLQSARAARANVEAKRRQQQLANAKEAASKLGPDQRCISGLVVRTRVQDGVPTYEQITRNGRPVRCVGNKRV